jgi:hypothetical protein
LCDLPPPFTSYPPKQPPTPGGGGGGGAESGEHESGPKMSFLLVLYFKEV